MTILRKNPHIYEINLMTWLHELSRKEKRRITLAHIPESEWQHLKEWGMDLVWLMGMWQRGPDSRKKARREKGLIREGRSILADFEMDDMVGSPYAVHDYVPDKAMGTEEDLRALKTRLERQGLSLILDFVPNHTACDHPWIKRHPEHYIQEGRNEEKKCGEGFFPAETDAGPKCIAHGKDPYFPPWSDTAQINYSRQETIEAVAGLLAHLASYCHGFRCDMAMLALKDVFQATWGRYVKEAAEVPAFWPLAAERLRSSGQDCLLLAEAYWGREGELLEQGFDYAYDKTLYDLMREQDISGLREYLSEPAGRQEKRVRFLENHDEPRAMEAFGAQRVRSAMVMQATLPGMRFWQHGQFEGARIRVPVQLRRAPREEVDQDLQVFSRALLSEVDHPVFHEGAWEICSTSGWADNRSHERLLAWTWCQGEERRLVAVNFSSAAAQGYVRLPTGWLPESEEIRLEDPLKGERFLRSRSETEQSGLYVGLGSGDFHFFNIAKV